MSVEDGHLFAFARASRRRGVKLLPVSIPLLQCSADGADRTAPSPLLRSDARCLRAQLLRTRASCRSERGDQFEKAEPSLGVAARLLAARRIAAANLCGVVLAAVQEERANRARASREHVAERAAACRLRRARIVPRFPRPLRPPSARVASTVLPQRSAPYLCDDEPPFRLAVAAPPLPARAACRTPRRV